MNYVRSGKRDGVTSANGHVPPALAPFTVPLSGPVSAWTPPGPDTPGHGRATVDKVRHAVSAAASHRAWLAAVPVVLVNAVAFCGQLAFLRAHLPWLLGGQVLVAVTLESVAVYLAWQAHLSLAADDSALRLRLSAYGFAAVIGVMNYSHYMAAHWRPTFVAVTFGLMSVSSPWLWSVHSRRVSRDALKARGLIEPHAVRLGATRWALHPYRSARVMHRATWAGEADPGRAIALVYPPAVPAPGDDMMTSPRHDTTAAPGVAGQPGKNGGDGTGLAGSRRIAVAAVATSAVDKHVDNGQDKTPDKPSPRRTALDEAAAVIRRHPDWPDAAAAKSAGVSVKTVQRARKAIDRSTT